MLRIPLENLNRTHHRELFIKDRKRLATATGVAFVDRNHIVVTHLVANRMYLYHIDYQSKEYKLIDQIDTTYGGKITMTDLLDHKDGRLITSNCNHGTLGIYRISDNKLHFEKEITNKKLLKVFCHGVRFHSYRPNITCSTHYAECSVDFIDEQGQILYQLLYQREFNPKDLVFISKDRIIVFYTTSRVLKNKNDANYISRLVYYHLDLDNKSHQIITTFDIDNSQGDSIVHHNGIIFVNNQLGDMVNILELKDNQIIPLDNLAGISFPHGLAIEPEQKLLAVTSYGENCVYIMENSYLK